MKITPISGYGVKGPACFLIETAGRRLLLDLGEGPEPGVKPKISNLGQVDAVLISHSHKDHVGSLDLLSAIGSPPVYATAAVKAFQPHPALAYAHPLALRGETTILGLTVETGRASHAPGGVWIRIGGADSVLYSGDWTAESILYPLDRMPQSRYFICDVAYGIYDTPLSECFEKLLATAKSNRTILPMPPEGRGLETAIALSENGVAVSLCPTHRRVGRLLVDEFPEALDLRGRERLATMLAQAGTTEDGWFGDGAVIAAGATAESGTARLFVEKHLNDQDVRIVFTGHVAGQGLAAGLIASGRAEQFRWNVHPRLRDVKSMLDIVRPEHFIPVFLPESKIADLLLELGR